MEIDQPAVLLPTGERFVHAVIVKAVRQTQPALQIVPRPYVIAREDVCPAQAAQPIRRIGLYAPPVEAAAMPETANQDTVDVRTLPPAERHPLIFGRFNALPVGEAFVLVNDHDPKPLFYQFKFEHEGQFSWDYLEQGPKVWRVQIGRVAPVR
jgi:uncharacterized protein (DUF2249 family)